MPNKHQVCQIFTLPFFPLQPMQTAFFIATGSCPVCVEHSIPLPHHASYSIADLNTLGVSLPSHLPSGDFIYSVEFFGERFLVYTFSYEDTASCRDADSSVHKLIAGVTLEVVSVAELVEEKNVLEATNVGGYYLFPENPPSYVLSKGNVITPLDNVRPPVSQEFRPNVAQRGQVIMASLRSLLVVQSKKLDISNSCTKNRRNCCQFTGGGETSTFQNALQLVLFN